MHIPLQDKHPVIQVVAFAGLSLMGLIAIMMLGVIAGVLVCGGEFAHSLMNSSPEGSFVLYMKYLQILSHLGMFIFPSIVFGRLAGGNVMSYFTLNKGFGIGVFITSALLILLSQPMINWLTEWNSALTLPATMSGTEAWMIKSEQEAAKMTEMFMDTTTAGGLMLNLLMMAIIPALGEELVFRGVIQKVLLKWFKTSWLAVLTTAIIFSAIHMQFYGFVPRLLLGLILGYAYFATGRLWVPILIHFINNGLVVVVFWLSKNGMIDIDPEKFGSYNDNPVMLIGSALLFLGVLYLFVLFARKNVNEQV